MFRLHKNISAKDVMDREFSTIDINASLNEMVEKMLSDGNEDIFVIDQQDRLISLFSLRDISQLINQQTNFKMKLGNFTEKEIIYIHEETDLIEARNLMIDRTIGRLPVLNGGKILGVIRNQEIRDHLYFKVEDIKEQIGYIVDNIHEALCIVDKNGIVILWNKNAEKLYNIPRKKIVGKPLEKYFPNALMTEVLKTKKTINNIQHSPKKGSDVAISSHPIYINGEFFGAISTERDITEIENLSKELKKANETVDFLEEEVNKLSGNSFEQIVGKSQAIEHCKEKAKQVAKTEVSIHINGETGTGKEMFANAIHDYSERSGLFVPVNCSAIPDELFESEFFGYVEGAFTGAKKSGKMGYFELADHGTIFLDEIADLSLGMQAKLLRVLQEGNIKRVGGEKRIDVDVRVISATNKDLGEMIKRGEFREDLFFRLNVVDIQLPPLRNRRDDIALFVQYFVDQLCEKNKLDQLSITKNAINTLINYQWPGNVRELRNVIEQMIVLSINDQLTKDDIPEYIKENTTKQVANDTLDLNALVESVEKNAIVEALKQSKGSKTKAAKLLNIPRTTLYYKIKQYELTDDEF